MIGVMLAIQGIYSLRVFGAETQVTFGLALSIPAQICARLSQASCQRDALALN